MLLFYTIQVASFQRMISIVEQEDTIQMRANQQSDQTQSRCPANQVDFAVKERDR